ncbi:MAG: AAA family ATPase [Armatimonadota bacterium]
MANQKIGDVARKIVNEVEHAIVGKREAVEMAVVTLLCEGHLLIEDVPGVGKTTLAKALAVTIGGEFRRVQFTPDLLPADITGSSIYNQKEGEFQFRPGPLFANVVLADEINRATPKTQSALLEAMEEGQVSTDGETRRLPRPFFVIATQNSVEMTGTFPLPEAQLDRFFARISLGYPDREAERQVLTDQQVSRPVDHLNVVITEEELKATQSDIRDTFVHDMIKDYIVDIVRATRASNQLVLGASPRATLHLMRAGQAKAAISGANSVRPDDIKEVAPYILGHRVMTRAEMRSKGFDASDIISQIVDTVTAPLPVG